MRTKPVSSYIWLGTALRFLQDAEEGWHLHKEGWVLENIKSLLAGLEELGLVVTMRSDGTATLRKFYERFKDTEPTRLLSEGEASELKKAASQLRDFVVAETGGVVAFTVTKKRLDTDRLLNDVSSLFSPGAYGKLPDIAKTDLRDAGRCIAFDLPTSAAFHLMRATEAAVRGMYCVYIKKGRVNPLLWGPMLESLSKKRKKPPQDLLNHLDHIRRSFRNPTQHPDATYDIEDVQDLFGLCVDAINRMSRLI